MINRFREGTIYALAVAVLAMGATAARGGNFAVERVIGGLTGPTSVAQAPGDNSSLYVTEKSGKIKRIDLSNGTVTNTFNLDTIAIGGSNIATTNVISGGLHTMTFHPDFNVSGANGYQKFYTTRVAGGWHNSVKPFNRLDEYTLSGSTVTHSRTLLNIEHGRDSNATHSIDWVGFNPAATGKDRTKLYLTIGDSLSSFAVGSHPDSSPYGKVLSFQTNNAAPPWKIYATGLRNPWKASFDRETGDMYIGDVGRTRWEEVNFIKAGDSSDPDFGWAIREGTDLPFWAGAESDDPSRSPKNPIHQTPHGAKVGDPEDPGFNYSITGGYVYRGPVTELQGKYFFAEFVNSKIWSAEFDRDTKKNAYNGNNLTNLDERQAELEGLVEGGATINHLSAFGEDNAGNLYMVDYGNYNGSTYTGNPGEGEIFVIIPEPGSGLLLLITGVGAVVARRRRRR